MSKRQAEIQRLTLKGQRLLGRAQALLEREKDEVARPAFAALVGKCFKFRNSYGSGEKWWLYVRILRLHKDSLTYDTVQFQNTSRSNIEIEYRQQWNFQQGNHFSVQNGWEEITFEEYDLERKQLLRRVKELLTATP
jgi:hypothetical protein